MSTPVWKSLDGAGAGGDWNGTEDFLEDPHATPLRNALILLGQASWWKDKFAGGCNVLGVNCPTNGNYDIINWRPIYIDNTGNRLSAASLTNGATRIAKFQYLLRVSDPVISVTPRIVYGSTIPGIGTTVATISGQSACNFTNEDFSGDASQVQQVAVTLPSSAQFWKAMFTVTGVPTTLTRAWLQVSSDLYIQP